MAECVTVQDRMCKEETSGYTTKEKCEDWPRQECTVVKKKVSQTLSFNLAERWIISWRMLCLTLIMFQVTKFTTMTGCNKEPTELCAPAGCGFREVRGLHIILKLS